MTDMTEKDDIIDDLIEDTTPEVTPEVALVSTIEDTTEEAGLNILGTDVYPVPLEYFNDESVMKAIVNYKHGLCASIPMMCPGQGQCPYGDTCDVEKPPVGTKCPMEMAIAIYTFMAIVKDLGVTPDQALTMVTIKMLVNNLIKYERCIRKLHSGELDEDRFVGITDGVGDPVVNREISIFVIEASKAETQIMKLSVQLGLKAEKNINNHMHLHGSGDYSITASNMREAREAKIMEDLGV